MFNCRKIGQQMCRKRNRCCAEQMFRVSRACNFFLFWLRRNCLPHYKGWFEHRGCSDSSAACQNQQCARHRDTKHAFKAPSLACQAKMWERIGTVFMAVVAVLAILPLMHHHNSLSADSELRGLSDLTAKVLSCFTVPWSFWGDLEEESCNLNLKNPKFRNRLSKRGGVWMKMHRFEVRGGFSGKLVTERMSWSRAFLRYYQHLF